MKKGLPFSLATAIMKISLVSAFIFSFSLCAYSTVSVGQEIYNKEISVAAKEQNIKFTLDKIAKAAGVKFSYSPELIQAVRKVTLVERNKRLSYVLDKLLPPLNISYSYFNNYIVLNKTASRIENNQAQPSSINTIAIEVSGKIMDTKGLALPGVSIQIKGTTSGTVSDASGAYKITVPDDNAVLVFKYLGYLTQEVVVSGRGTINITMLEDAKNLDEVVVVAYGKTTQRSSTGALQSVNSKELEDIPASQFTQKLQGKLAGVEIAQTSGTPGQGLQVRIRGSASISTSSVPLYVVDGAPIAGDISNINPDEIETVTVLKDAASTALYGSRAAFGVVLITTKSAKAGQTNVSVNAYSGFQKMPQKGRPDMMDGAEWAEFKKESYEDLGQPVPAAFQNPSQYGKGTDWYGAMLRTGKISDYSVSVSTNKDKFSNSFTAGYYTQDGVVLNSNYTRISLRNNAVYKVTDNFRIGVNIAPVVNYGNVALTDGFFAGGNGLLANAGLTPPILNYKNPDGSLPVTVTTPGITAFNTPNWVRSIQDIKNQVNTNRLLSNVYAEYEPIAGLTLKSSINFDLGQTSHNYFQPSTASLGFASTPSALNASLGQNNSGYYSWTSENTATYTKRINKHEFDLLAGYTVQRFRSDATNVSGSDFPDDRIQTIDAALVKNPSSMDVEEWALISYLARLNYDYDHKYLFSASIRRDGSSRFGINNQYGNFPAVSAAWVVSEEPFAKKIDALSFMKIRGSYGLVGNNNIGNYTQYATVNSGVNSPFGATTESGIAVTGLGNSNLGWENTNELDLGVEIGILKGRVNFTYDYYNKKTSNLLFSLPVPLESGFSSFPGNIGEVKFWGHEFSINSNNMVGKFKWNTGFNIAFSNNKVLKLSGLTNAIYTYTGVGETITKVGSPIGQFYGLVQKGVYKNQADYDNSPKNVDSQVGTIKYKDVNGDGVITFGDGPSGDKTVIGNPYPKFTYGITNSFSYKNFDLSIVATGSYGNQVAETSEQGTTNLDGVFNVLKAVQYRWRSPSDPGAGVFGKTTAATGDARDRFSSLFIKPGSYLAIKDITLGYSVPVKNWKPVKSIRLYSSVHQAFVFTKYDGANPEIGTDVGGNPPNALIQGFDFSAYPVPRTITFGLNVNLN
ncbi:TonB-dependent receptor [Mucilaginibacter sp. BJC16-A38]|uniref:TonB-dependent receptor n=1 Tax=Mucilaginibacter phenanthrenivorans TaxID=1234842 RepID=UPI0021578845|nr:TonB-dependent receptor [Mucilaginibacter phenanthrenivorans]MCR8556721.1 TonB-dependent receptor [Mucilaginibacter phenanthrenivorans]